MPLHKAQYELNRLISDLKKEKFKYKPKEQKDTIDWRSYNQAQLEEIDNQLILIRNMVNEAAGRLGKMVSPRGREGRPRKDARDRAKAILVQQYFMASDRLAAGLMWFLREKLQTTERLTPKDIERAYDDPDAIAILIQVFRMTNEPVKDSESEFSIDGSGLPTSIKHNYANDREAKKVAGYHMLIGMVGLNTKLFTAVEVMNSGSESPYLKPLLNQTVQMYSNIDMVTADAMYLSRANCTAISDAGGTPYIYPKTGVFLNQRGSRAWKVMLLALIQHPQRWLEEYHKRSISESINSVWKRKFLRPLMREKDDRRKVEAFARAVCYNIRRLPYLHYLHDVEVPWLTAV